MDGATVFMLGVTVTGAIASVIKTVREVKEFVYDVKHHDENIAQFCAEMQTVELTLDIVKQNLERLGPSISTPDTISPQSAIGNNLEALHTSAARLAKIFRTLDRYKIVKELRLRDKARELIELRRRLGLDTAHLHLRMSVLMFQEQRLARTTNEQILGMFRAWREDFPEQLSRLLTHHVERDGETQQLIETASIAYEEGASVESDSRGYVDPTKIEATEKWIKSNPLNGPPPSEASYPPTLAFSNLDIDDDQSSFRSNTGTAAANTNILVSHEMMKVKFDLINEGLTNYDAGDFNSARDDFQEAFDMGPHVSVLSFDETMTEKGLSLWLCLTIFRRARYSSEPHRSSRLKQAHSLLGEIEDESRSHPSSKTHKGRHLDAILLAEIYI